MPRNAYEIQKISQNGVSAFLKRRSAYSKMLTLVLGITLHKRARLYGEHVVKVTTL